MADPKKISEAKKPQRDAVVNPELRQAVALEEIADQLECIRIDLVGLQNFLGRVLK